MTDTTATGMRGPGIFLAQFMSAEAPFDTLANIAHWAASQGYKAIQLPTLGTQFIDLERAAEDQNYCDELKAVCAQAGVEISELSTHLQGQLVAVHPAFDTLFDDFAPAHLRGQPQARTEWAIDQLKLAARASKRLGLKAHATFSGALLWPYLYPWPQRPSGLVEQGFAELAKRWLPILECFEEAGVDLCYEIHPGEDLHDGVTFEMFLQRVGNHPRCKILFDPSHFVLQQLNYLDYLDIYRDFIRMFHVKDAEFNPTGRQGIYGGYQGWADRAGRFRSLGDGQVDFKGIFSKLALHDYAGWATLEWECCLKDQDDGARQGVAFINEHIIRVTDKVFDDFAGAAVDQAQLDAMLGLARPALQGRA